MYPRLFQVSERAHIPFCRFEESFFFKIPFARELIQAVSQDDEGNIMMLQATLFDDHIISSYHHILLFDVYHV